MRALQIDRDAFDRDGYLLFSGLFGPAEVAEMRRLAIAGRAHAGDMLSHPLLGGFALDDRVVSIAKALIRPPIVYFGEGGCNFQQDPPMRFHKDNTDRYDPDGPDWRGGFSLIRFGLYLQDHLRHSGGLAVQPGSHLIASRKAGPERYLGPGAGDLLVWDMRITHRGRASLFRWTRRPVPARIDRRLPRFLRANGDRERIVLFVSYGGDDEHLTRYLTYSRTRPWSIEKWSRIDHPPELVEKARAKGVVVHDVKAELAREPVLPVSRKHHQIPYPPGARRRPGRGRRLL